MARCLEPPPRTTAAATWHARPYLGPRHCYARWLDRLSWHYRGSLTGLVEKLAESAERVVEAKLTAAELEPYRAGYERDRPSYTGRTASVTHVTLALTQDGRGQHERHHAGKYWRTDMRAHCN